jgi:hypothetical protein
MLLLLNSQWNVKEQHTCSSLLHYCVVKQAHVSGLQRCTVYPQVAACALEALAQTLISYASRNALMLGLMQCRTSVQHL